MLLLKKVFRQFRGRATKFAAVSAVIGGVSAPAIRKKTGLKPATVLSLAAAAPVGLYLLLPASRQRNCAVIALQMWAYLAAYEMPYDDPQGLKRRVKLKYPITFDRIIGLGELPGVRIQSWRLRRGGSSPLDKPLAWAHWAWFAVPHLTTLYIMFRYPKRFPKAAAMQYATFDLGAVIYWLLPTAPPWYAAKKGYLDRDGKPAVRRLMFDYGERFWGKGWSSLSKSVGGNPLAAMPSLHFGTSVMAAKLLNETGTTAGLIGWSYALTLGLALVYLGEHYVLDLIVGFLLAEGLRRYGEKARPAVEMALRVLKHSQKKVQQGY